MNVQKHNDAFVVVVVRENGMTGNGEMEKIVSIFQTAVIYENLYLELNELYEKLSQLVDFAIA